MSSYDDDATRPIIRLVIRVIVHAHGAACSRITTLCLNMTIPRMGTHPNCPSVVASTGASLQSWIEAHPESLGQHVQRRFGSGLPFLFKVSCSVCRGMMRFSLSEAFQLKSLYLMRIDLLFAYRCYYRHFYIDHSRSMIQKRRITPPRIPCSGIVCRQSSFHTIPSGQAACREAARD